MASLNLKRFQEGLKGEGFDNDQISKVLTTIAPQLPDKTYNLAVIFLGCVTALLALGSVVLAYQDPASVPDALWGALGTGIGGLAGIFMGDKS